MVIKFADEQGAAVGGRGDRCGILESRVRPDAIYVAGGAASRERVNDAAVNGHCAPRKCDPSNFRAEGCAAVGDVERALCERDAPRCCKEGRETRPVAIADDPSARDCNYTRR